jgi:predicted RecB family nuclease
MARCREIAEKADDLSLLARMSAAERQHYQQKGIFSVTQLSYTYRHPRRAKARHEHALKALAIRKNQTHVTGKIEWNVSGTPVYIDVDYAGTFPDSPGGLIPEAPHED